MLSFRNAEEARSRLLPQSRDKLKKYCKSLKVSAEGSKSDLIGRIVAANNFNNDGRVVAEPAASDTTAETRRRLLLQRRTSYKPATRAPSKAPRASKKSANTNRRKQRKKVSGKNAKKAVKATKSKSKSKPKAKSKPKPVPTDQPLTFKFVGIDSGHYVSRHCSFHHFSGLDTKALVIDSPLTVKSTISALKKFIREIYGLGTTCDILIIFAHIVISANNDAKLSNFGITDNSVLLLAVSASPYRETRFNQTHRVLYRNLKHMKVSNQRNRQRGLDIITQETNVSLYKMPVCGHFMSKESLYHYVMSAAMDPSHLYFQCPHTKTNTLNQRTTYRHTWTCPQCSFTNKAVSAAKAMSCTVCRCANPQPNIDSSSSTSSSNTRCGALWHYSLIKQILTHRPSSNDELKENFDDFDLERLELLSSRKVVENSQKFVDLQKCPECNSLHFRPSRGRKKRRINIADIHREFHTDCRFCSAPFCWNCGKESEMGHICNTEHQQQFVQLLQSCPAKRIGSVDNVPSIRACPNPDCRQLIHHVDACKHMKCRFCRTDFCFVCMKKKLNGQWQCGTHSTVCRVFARQTLRDVLSTTHNGNVQVELNKTFQLF